jgi:hypothetical protein
VWDLDRKRFAKRYEAFKAGKDAVSASGTPLSMWPAIHPRQIKELEFFNIFTLEQLAEMPDANAQKIGPISELRNRARAFIEAAKGNAPLERMAIEKQKMQAENEALKKRMDLLEAALAKHKER